MQWGDIHMQKSGTGITHINTEAVSPLGSVCMHHVQPVGPDRASNTDISAALSLAASCSQRPLTVNGHECDLMPGWAFPLVFHLRFKLLVKFRKCHFYLIRIVCVSVPLTPLDLLCCAGMIMTPVLGWIFSAG